MREKFTIPVCALGLITLVFGCLYVLQSCLDANDGLPAHIVHRELGWGLLLLAIGLSSFLWAVTQPPPAPKYHLMTTTKERENGKKS